MGLILFWKTLILIIVCKKVHMLPNADDDDVHTKDISSCEDGWTRHLQNCFKVVSENADWRNASEKCRNLGGHLASIHSKEENDLMIELFMEIGKNYWWIGMHDQDLDGIFEWVDGTKDDYTNWRPSEPDGFYSSGNCVAVSISLHFGNWVVFSCGSFYSYACQKKVATSSGITSAAVTDTTLSTSVTAGAGLADRTVSTSVTSGAGLAERTVSTYVTSGAGLAERIGFLLVAISLIYHYYYTHHVHVFRWRKDLL